MKTLKAFLVLSVAAGLAVAAWRFAPQQWFRKAGLLDLAVVLDWSGSYADQLPKAVNSAKLILRRLLPGDRLAVFAVGPEVNELAQGAVTTAHKAILSRQLESLRPSERGGTALGETLGRVAEALEDFGKQPSPTHTHRRLVVIFSDCVGEPAHDVQFKLPGSASVLVIGFRGEKRDAVTMALLGDGSNDVHIVAPEEASQAVESLLKTIRDQAHPLRWVAVAMGIVLCLALATFVVEGTARLMTRPPSTLRIRLQQPRDPEAAQDFVLPADGNTITIGGGDELHDFAVPVKASCSLSRNGSSLILSPVNGELGLRRTGERFQITEPSIVETGDSILLEDCEVAIQRA